jgi:ABC-type nitrate/sulfonate/bicarbonate transport system substrate-binding protein
MKNRAIAAILVLLLAVSLTGCAGNDGKTTGTTNAAAGQAKKLFPLRQATPTNFDEVMIASRLGFFEEEGIEIKNTGVLRGGASAIQTVTQGVNDIFNGHPPNVAQAILAGAKVKAVAPGQVDNPNTPHVAYLVKEDSPIKSLQDIVGKKVAQTSSTSVCQDGYLKMWLKQHHLPLNVEWVKLPNPGQQEQALRQGLVDVTTSHQPYSAVALKQGGLRQIATSYDIVKTPAGGLSIYGFSEKFIAEHPDVVRGFCKALAKVRPWINTHPKEAADIVAKEYKLDPDQVTSKMFEENPQIDPAAIELWFKIAEDVGLWKPGDIKPTDTYTNEFAPKQ